MTEKYRRIINKRDTMKLYEVYTNKYKAYVVAKNPLAAENEFKSWLDSEDYGYSGDRVVNDIRLIADTNCKPNSIIYPVDMLIGAIMEDEQ